VGLLHLYQGQKGQDLWVIDEVFKHKRDGYFVDLAATDGLLINNTLVLERDLGWSGICIEANPDYFEALQNNRSCHTIQACVDDLPDKLITFRTDNGDLGGIVDEDTDNSYAIRAEELQDLNTKLITLRTRTLADILAECNAPPILDYLSLDVEGAETRILSTFPFDRYTFRTLTIERPTPELEQRLFDNDYLFIRRQQFDTFYIHHTVHSPHVSLQPYEPTPKKDW